MDPIRFKASVTQPLVPGASSVRTRVIFAEPLLDGIPSLRYRSGFVNPLVAGFSQVRLTTIGLQALFPAQEERPVSTTPFPGFGNSPTDPSVPAAADPFNTRLPGLQIEVRKSPRFRTNIAEAASGFEVRNAQAEYPRWDFELSYEFLEDRTGAESSLKTIMGFFLARQGSFDSWLFKDPDDYLAVAGLCGTADGVTTEFPLRRTIGEFHELVGQVDTANDITIYVDGVAVDPADYEIMLPNAVVFDSAPADTAIITADFQFYFACRFSEDSMEFEKFMDKLWNLQSVEFRSIIQ